MLTNDQAQQLLSGGGNVIAQDGDKIGSIGQVFLDDTSGQPEWVTVNTGFFGTGESFVPLRGAEVSGNDLRVPYDKAKVKDAPRISDSNGHLSEEEEDTL
jgi:sporulation protein YlmC with PRC-barrel domain